MYAAVMGPPEILRELSALADRLGVDLRFEALGGTTEGRGGLCRIHGHAVIVVERELPILEKIDVLTGALSRFDLEKVYMPPELRARLERLERS